MVKRQAKKEEQVPFRILPCKELAQVWNARYLYHSAIPRYPLFGGSRGTIQCVWQDRIQSSGSDISVVQQHHGSDSRESRQLQFLRGGCMDQVTSYIHNCNRNLRDCIHPGMETRQDMVQHHLPCGYHIRFLLTLQSVCTSDQYRQVQQLRTMRQSM